MKEGRTEVKEGRNSEGRRKEGRKEGSKRGREALRERHQARK